MPTQQPLSGQSGCQSVFSNRSFLDDDSNPPSYHSIYPSAIATSVDDGSKEQKSSSSVTTVVPSSNLVENLFQNTSHDGTSQQEPIISYDQLYSPSHFLYSGSQDHHHHITCLPNTLVVQQQRLPSAVSRTSPR